MILGRLIRGLNLCQLGLDLVVISCRDVHPWPIFNFGSKGYVLFVDDHIGSLFPKESIRRILEIKMYFWPTK